jgi:hypothetical protein
MALRDGYYFIDVTWKSGFKHTVPCRGFNLKSEIAFNQSIFWIDSIHYYEVTKEQYEEKTWESSLVADIEPKTTTKRTTSQPKRGKSLKKDGVEQSTTPASAKTARKTTKLKTQSSTATKKKPTGSKETKNDRPVPVAKRTTKAKPSAKEKHEASPKVTRKKRSEPKDGKQDGKLSPASNKRKPKSTTN